MYQKFFTDTLESRFIKSLLASVRLPLLNHVYEGEVVIKGCYYIYDGWVIKIHESGKLAIDQSDKLYPSDTLYPSIMLFPGTGFHPARFYVICRYDSISINAYNYRFHSTINYYDNETHKYLGEYLRDLKGLTGLNLLPFYNCFNYHVINNLSLEKPSANNKYKSYVQANNKSYKTYIIPIKFNKLYTIALDSSYEILLRGIIYGPSGLITYKDGYYSDESELVNSFKIIPQATFDKPFLFSIETTNANLYQLEKYLYLIIQVPKSHESSITILEGDYTESGSIRTSGGVDGGEPVRIYENFYNLSLLKLNTKVAYAFSNRLIEYLLLSVINPNEELTDNIKLVQKSLYKIDNIYKRKLERNEAYLGYWDTEITNAIFRLIEKTINSNYLLDMDGNINKDIEKLLKEGRT